MPLDEARVRRRGAAARRGPPGTLAVLSRWLRLVRLDRAKRLADVESAVPLPTDVRARIEAALARVRSRQIATSFADNPALIGGVRVKVGSDVYDGSVQGHLAALESRF